MSGYWADPEATARVLRDGWLYTGDLARLCPEGWLQIAGRRNDFVKTSLGQRVHPSEIEAALECHDAVMEAGVCGFVSRFGDEQLAAFVVPKTVPADSDALKDELRRHVRAELGPRKTPRVLRLTDGLPRNRLGKLLRHVLAEKLESQ
jgi:long-chain acyl-CoA synthetase